MDSVVVQQVANSPLLTDKEEAVVVVQEAKELPPPKVPQRVVETPKVQKTNKRFKVSLSLFINS